MGRNMGDTGKNTENRAKSKKAGASGGRVFSVVGGGKREAAAAEPGKKETGGTVPEKKTAGSPAAKGTGKNTEKQITALKEAAEKKGKTKTPEADTEKAEAGKTDIKKTKTVKKKTTKQKSIHKKNAKKKSFFQKSEGVEEKKKEGPETIPPESRNSRSQKEEAGSGASADSKKEDLKKGESGKEEAYKKKEAQKKETQKQETQKQETQKRKEEAQKKKTQTQKAEIQKEETQKEEAQKEEKKQQSGKKESAKGKTKKSAAKGGAQEKDSVKKTKKKKGTAGKKKTPSKTRTGKKDDQEPETQKTDETVSAAKKSSRTKSRNPNLRLVKSGEDAGEKKERKKESYREYDDKVYMGGLGIGEWFIQHKSLLLMGLTACAIVGAITWGYYFIVTNYRVTTVYVDGNVHYSNEEIMEMVMTGPYGNNSLYLAMKYKDKGVEGVPFVEKMDVNILTPNTIRINVYEKALAGYVEYLGRYMYFDRDGIVVESSREKTTGIPQVTGLQFGYVILNEALPVENDTIFKRILSITQLLDKYELSADKIYFDSDYDLTLYFGGVKVTLGASEEIDEKVMRLQYILPELSGKTGTLSMENYTEDSKSIPFRQN